MKHHSSTSQRDSNPRILFIVLCVLSIFLADQITKQLIKMYVPLYWESGVSIPVLGDFFRIIHVENSALAFSLGRNFPPLVKRFAYTILPLALLLVLGFFALKDKTLSLLRKKAVIIILAGGLGNIFDRVFRGGKVIDFLDVKFFGIFGFERWPTFNIADTAVVVGVLLFIVAGLLPKRSSHE